jgi:hypothetical protein
MRTGAGLRGKGKGGGWLYGTPSAVSGTVTRAPCRFSINDGNQARRPAGAAVL